MKKALLTLLVVALTTIGGSLLNPLSAAPAGTVIRSCDHRIEMKVISCKRFGSTVTLEYFIMNNSFGDAKQFRIHPPAASTYTLIYDNEGNHYAQSTFTLGTDKATGHAVSALLMEGVPYKASITIQNVPASATHMSYMLYVMAYGHEHKTDSEYITFRNIPITQE